MEILEAGKIRFTLDDAQKAGDEWGFNCGPAALCAVLAMTPEEIRPHLLEFEQKRYTNPTLMANILSGLRVDFVRVFECRGTDPPLLAKYPDFGLVRVQWAGPWTKAGVPMRVRYRHTHWIATCKLTDGPRFAFDVNAMCAGGWLPWDEWENQLVPWLLKQVAPKATGEWWPTHCWGIDLPQHQGEARK